MIAQASISQNVIRDYITLTKPRIILLLLVTAMAGMFLASQGVPDLLLALWVLIGGSLASGGANAINHALDHDIDELMSRTSNRPVVNGRVSERNAIAFGVGLNVAAFALMGTLVNPLSAILTLLATFIYVFVYTLGLKRTSTQNIVIGGASGAIPPLVGWAAVTGTIGIPGLYLFAIVFFWTPPHFWALSLLIKDDYARANIPMLPVVVGIPETKKSIFMYTILVTAVSMMFVVTQAVGYIYLISALVLGLIWIYYSYKLLRSDGINGAKAAYLYSLAYLGLLFIAVMVDSAV